MHWDSFLVSLITGGLAGGSVGAIVNHLLAKSREQYARDYARETAAANRKQDFLGFMDGWRTEIERINIRVIADQFSTKCAEFRREATKIRSDYDEPKFWQLVDSLSSLRGSEIEEGANQGDKAVGKTTLLTRLDAIVNFVKTH
jgi:hypothetical protein